MSTTADASDTDKAGLPCACTAILNPNSADAHAFAAMSRAQASSAPRHAGVANAVMSNISGMQAAQHLLQGLRDGCAAPDLLLTILRQVQAENDEGKLAGFVRELQKALERTA